MSILNFLQKLASAKPNGSEINLLMKTLPLEVQNAITSNDAESFKNLFFGCEYLATETTVTQY